MNSTPDGGNFWDCLMFLINTFFWFDVGYGGMVLGIDEKFIFGKKNRYTPNYYFFNWGYTLITNFFGRGRLGREAPLAAGAEKFGD